MAVLLVFFFFQAEDGIRDYKVTGVQTCALPISVCVSMAFERPPETRPRIRWETRPLVWVAGEGKSPRVPPRDFVFGALRLALDSSDPWAEPALAAYTRAARATPTLCDAMATFKVAADVPTCRK